MLASRRMSEKCISFALKFQTWAELRFGSDSVQLEHLDYILLGRYHRILHLSVVASVLHVRLLQLALMMDASMMIKVALLRENMQCWHATVTHRDAWRSWHSESRPLGEVGVHLLNPHNDQDSRCLDLWDSLFLHLILQGRGFRWETRLALPNNFFRVEMFYLRLAALLILATSMSLLFPTAWKLNQEVARAWALYLIVTTTQMQRTRCRQGAEHVKDHSH